MVRKGASFVGEKRGTPFLLFSGRRKKDSSCWEWNGKNACNICNSEEELERGIHLG